MNKIFVHNYSILIKKGLLLLLTFIIVLSNVSYTNMLNVFNICVCAPTTYSITLRSSEVNGSSLNKGVIVIDNFLYNPERKIRIEEGDHIIYYIPESEYVFDHWKAYQKVKLISQGDEDGNMYLIRINGNGVILARYRKGPKFDITPLNPSNGTVIRENPIKFEVMISSEGEIVENAEVTYYINNNMCGSCLTDEEGRAAYNFNLNENQICNWHVRVTKHGHETTNSSKWNFLYIDFNLRPSDGKIITWLPLSLSTQIVIDGEYFEGSDVIFILDNEPINKIQTQSIGYASTIIEKIDPGLHKWSIIASIPGWGHVQSNSQTFQFQRELNVLAMNPKKGIAIAEFNSKVDLEVIVTANDEPIANSNVSFYVDDDYIGSVLSDVNGTAKCEFKPSYENKEYYWYATASLKGAINDTSIVWDFFYPIQPPYIEVDKIFTSRNRADLDSFQKIGFHLSWENESCVQGAIIKINDESQTVTDSDGWAFFTVTCSDVDIKKWNIVEVRCNGMGEFIDNSLYPEIIWDKVVINLYVEKNRVDVNTKLTPEFRAYYDYDDSIFYGDVEYNMDPIIFKEVGKKNIFITKINDKSHNLTKFDCNKLEVIWDKVLVHIELREARIEKCSKAEIICNGKYAYDNKKFSGIYEIKGNLTRCNVGKEKFDVIKIIDDLHGLTKFDVGEVICIFDGLNVTQKIITILPTQVKVITFLNYLYDNAPVNNASVKVNGIGRNIGNGKYVSTIYTFQPVIIINTNINLKNFQNIIKYKRVYASGNLFIEIGTTIIIVILWRAQVLCLGNDIKRRLARTVLREQDPR